MYVYSHVLLAQVRATFIQVEVASTRVYTHHAMTVTRLVKPMPIPTLTSYMMAT